MKKLLMMLFFVASLCACGDRTTSTPVEGNSIVVDSVEVVDTLNLRMWIFGVYFVSL